MTYTRNCSRAPDDECRHDAVSSFPLKASRGPAGFGASDPLSGLGRPGSGAALSHRQARRLIAAVGRPAPGVGTGRKARASSARGPPAVNVRRQTTGRVPAGAGRGRGGPLAPPRRVIERRVLDSGFVRCTDPARRGVSVLHRPGDHLWFAAAFVDSGNRSHLPTPPGSALRAPEGIHLRSDLLGSSRRGPGLE